MADEMLSKLGFDVSQAVTALNSLKRQFDSYSNSLAKAAGDSSKFNTTQAKVDDLLKRSATSAQLAAAQLKKYAAAQNEVAIASAKAARQPTLMPSNEPALRGATRAALAAAKAREEEARAAREAAKARKQVEGQFANLRGKATLGEIVNFDKSLEQFQKLVQSTRTSSDQVSRILGNLRGQYTGTERQVRDAIAAIIASNAKLGSANFKAQGSILKQIADADKRAAAERAKVISDIKRQEAELRALFGNRGSRPPGGGGPGGGGGFIDPEGIKKDKDKLKELGISWKNLIKIFATQFVFRGIGQVISQFTQAFEAARKFEVQLAQIQTLSKQFQSRGLEGTADVVRNLSDQFGAPIEDVASGLYETLSNQIGDASDSTRFLSDALTFGKAALVSTSDSVDLLSGVINSYNLTAASAANISDQLFVTIDRGRVKGSDLANTFGRILPLASTLGIQLAEVNTALAELTIQGVKPSDALTQLTNVMLKLIKPTEALQAEFDKIGITSAEAGIALFSFDGLIRKVTEASEGSSTEIGKLFNQIRGTRGVIGLITRDTEKYARTLEAIRGASRNAGAAVEAAGIIMQTPAEQLARELNKLRNLLIEDFGRPAISLVVQLTKAVGGLTVPFFLLAGAVGLFATGSTIIFLAQLKAGLLALVPAAKAANFSMLGLAGTVALIASPVIALVLTRYLTQVSDLSGQAQASMERFGRAVDANVKKEIRASREGIEARKKQANESFAALIGGFVQVEKLYQEDKAAAFRTQEDVTNHLKDQLSQRTSAITNFLSQLEGIQKQAGEKIKALQQDTVDFEFNIDESRFQRQLSNLTNPQDTGDALASRVTKLLRGAQNAISGGNVDFGKQLFDTALANAEKLAGVKGQEQRGEGLINLLLRERQQINNKLIEQEQEKANQAKIAEDAVRQNLLGVQRNIEKFNEVNDRIAKEQLKPGTAIDANVLKSLVAERQNLAKAIDTGISKVSVSNLPALKSLLDLQKEVRDGFTTRDGRKGSLEFASTEGFKEVLANFQRTADQTPIEIKVAFKALTGDDFNPFEGTARGQNAAVQLRNQQLAGIENESNLPALAGDASKAQQAVNQAVSALGRLNEQVRNIRGLQPVNFFSREQLDKDFLDAQSKLDTLDSRINAALARAQTGETGPLEALLADLQKAEAIAKQNAAANGGIFGLMTGDANVGNEASQILGVLRQRVEELATAQTKQAQAQKEAQATRQIETAINTGDPAALEFLRIQSEAKRRQDDLNLSVNNFGSTATNSIGVAQTAVNGYTTQGMIDQNARAIASFRELAAAQAASGGGAAVQGRQRGGLVRYLANGGFVPRGTDTVPAMLSPGEFVMNAKSTRKFYSQLVAMNAGSKPVYRAEGGMVTNTFGDINVNMPAGAKGSDPRAIAQGIRRELRRQTSKR